MRKRKGFGPKKIFFELKEKGIPDLVARKIIEETKKTESRENSTGSNPNLTENDSHREGNEKAGNNQSY